MKRLTPKERGEIYLKVAERVLTHKSKLPSCLECLDEIYNPMDDDLQFHELYYMVIGYDYGDGYVYRKGSPLSHHEKCIAALFAYEMTKDAKI